MTLKEAIKYVKEVCLSEEIIPSPEMILDTATRIFISQNISQSKRDNIQAIKSQPVQSQGKSVLERNKPPFSSGKSNHSASSPEYLSPKQIYFFKVRKLPFPSSYEEAVETISQIKQKEEY